MDLFSPEHFRIALFEPRLSHNHNTKNRVVARTMMNALHEPKSLPATEALNVSISSQMIPERELRKAQLVTPQSSNDSLESSAAPERKKRSFDMADLLTATEPVEQAIAFPTIEWCRDGDDDEEEDESENDANDLSAIHPLTDNHDDDNDYFPSFFSTSGLGKRSRHGYSRLGRSKSLKTSLCSLAEDSAPTFEDVCSKPGGSWPRFSLGTSEARDARREHKRQKSLKSTQQDLRINILVPLVA